MTDPVLEAIERVQAVVIAASKAKSRHSAWASVDHYRGMMAWDEMVRILHENPDIAKAALRAPHRVIDHA